MTIEAVDFFYLSMPEVLDIGDGSQDSLLVRVVADGIEGWGECEASPLTSIAAYVCPMSHGACKPVRDVVLGRPVTSPAEIRSLSAAVERDCMDLLQASHTFSGIEMALWDILGKKVGEPVYRLLGQDRAHPKVPYASQLFGDTPQDTLESCRKARSSGFRAVKCGWGPYGAGSVSDDRDHVAAAREGLGPGGILLIDAGQIWREDVEAASLRLPALRDAKAMWLEEPFYGGAYGAYAELAAHSGAIGLAGGEASHNFLMARQLVDYAKVSFLQIDCGRIGGIGPAFRAAAYAAAKGVTYVNHTFTSHLALSASLQPYAGLRAHEICEYPFAPKPLAWDITENHVEPDADGYVRLPDAPGLGMTISAAALAKYRVDVEISAKDRLLYRTPAI